MSTVRKDGGSSSSGGSRQRHQPYWPSRSKQNENPLKTEGKRKIQGHKAKNNGFFGNSPIFRSFFLLRTNWIILSFASDSFFPPSCAFLCVSIFEQHFLFLCVRVCVCATSFFICLFTFLYVTINICLESVICHWTAVCLVVFETTTKKKVSLPFRCQIETLK